ncbi:hypothetical protein ACFQ3N_17940 [Virgibacillus byunsanensis]|uniref:Flavoprotein domain-containing protein n=1 Tax=Virgibacillus byunsanensis TaxID=570945 RepID=A0ABW3LR17_9BACI
MQVNQQSSVVDATLRELLLRNKTAHQKTVYALLFYHMGGMEEGLQSLKALHEHGIRVRIIPDERILDHYRVTDLARRAGIDDWISLNDFENQKQQVDHVYIPILPFSTVSDLLNFNDTRSSIRMVMGALMKGKKVSAFSAGANPYHSIWQDVKMNHGTPLLKHQMKKQLQQIRGFGVHLIDHADEVVNHFITDFHQEKRQVITADDMKKQAKIGRRSIEWEQGTIITPLARDIAREHNIEIGEK